MESKVSTIAHNLIEVLKDTLQISEKEIGAESFKLIFHVNSFSFIFLCSIHHLDMPWQIKFKVEEKNENSKHISGKSIYIKDFEITPVFLSDVNLNAKTLAETIKLDVIHLIQELRVL